MKKMSLVVGATFAFMALTLIQSHAAPNLSVTAGAVAPTTHASVVEPSAPDQGREASLFKSNHVGAILPKSADSSSSMWAMMVGGIALLIWRIRMLRTAS